MAPVAEPTVSSRVATRRIRRLEPSASTVMPLSRPTSLPARRTVVPTQARARPRSPPRSPRRPRSPGRKGGLQSRGTLSWGRWRRAGDSVLGRRCRAGDSVLRRRGNAIRAPTHTQFRVCPASACAIFGRFSTAYSALNFRLSIPSVPHPDFLVIPRCAPYNRQMHKELRVVLSRLVSDVPGPATPSRPTP